MKKSHKSHLELWFEHPDAEMYFGRRFAFKFAVLAHVATGTGTLAEIARQHGASRQAAFKHAKDARQIFGIGIPSKHGLTEAQGK